MAPTGVAIQGGASGDEPLTAPSKVGELVAASWGAKREMKEQRGRADHAEAEVRKLEAEISAMRSELAAKAEREEGRKAAAAVLSNPFRVSPVTAEARALKVRNDALRVENEDLKAELVEVATQLLDLEEQVATICGIPQAVEAPPQVAHEEACAGAPPLPSPDDAAGLNKRARAAKKKEEARRREEAQQQEAKAAQAAKATSPKKADKAAIAAARDAEARLAARIAEEQRLQQAAAKQARGVEPDSDEENDAAERERVRREDEERWALRAAEQAAAEEAAREQERQKKLRAEEKRRAAKEERLRIEEEKKVLPKEDFEALQMLRAELQQPDAEQSPGEEVEDDETVLEREMRRAEKEAKELKEKEGKPQNFMDMMLHMSGLPVGSEMQEVAKAKQRSALKEKLRAKREMQSLIGTTVKGKV